MRWIIQKGFLLWYRFTQLKKILILIKSNIIPGNLGMDDEKGIKSGGSIITVFHQK